MFCTIDDTRGSLMCSERRRQQSEARSEAADRRRRALQTFDGARLADWWAFVGQALPFSLSLSLEGRAIITGGYAHRHDGDQQGWASASRQNQLAVIVPPVLLHSLVEHVRLGMVGSRRNNHGQLPKFFSSYHQTLSSSPAMSSSSSSTEGPSDADRKLTESPAPFSEGLWDYEIIPKTHNNRTLVLCFDGTGDKFDADVRKPTTVNLLSSPTILISAQ